MGETDVFIKDPTATAEQIIGSSSGPGWHPRLPPSLCLSLSLFLSFSLSFSRSLPLSVYLFRIAFLHLGAITRYSQLLSHCLYSRPLCIDYLFFHLRSSIKLEPSLDTLLRLGVFPTFLHPPPHFFIPI